MHTLIKEPELSPQHLLRPEIRGPLSHNNPIAVAIFAQTSLIHNIYNQIIVFVLHLSQRVELLVQVPEDSVQQSLRC